ncbi:hypothetical protein DRO29_01005 [Candidatus Bathyarchaeota archaeon]|nr:MAG: hypothetical protein DRO29_01005 [Candidatus Bathyarchaeota archaeon]HDJ04696.1 transcriptional regulator [Candidatus Bathyarchaeota archaeon]
MDRLSLKDKNDDGGSASMSEYIIETFDLAKRFEAKPLVSRHLKILKDCGLVKDRKYGNRRNRRIYSVTGPRIFNVIDGFSDGLHPRKEDHPGRNRSNLLGRSERKREQNKQIKDLPVEG